MPSSVGGVVVQVFATETKAKEGRAVCCRRLPPSAEEAGRRQAPVMLQSGAAGGEGEGAASHTHTRPGAQGRTAMRAALLGRTACTSVHTCTGVCLGAELVVARQEQQQPRRG